MHGAGRPRSALVGFGGVAVQGTYLLVTQPVDDTRKAARK